MNVRLQLNVKPIETKRFLKHLYIPQTHLFKAINFNNDRNVADNY